MLSTTKFVLGFALSLFAASAAFAGTTEPDAGWFGKCLRCEWDPWGGPSYCAVSPATGFYGCYANGYKCSVGGSPCGKKPIAVDGEAPTGGTITSKP